MDLEESEKNLQQTNFTYQEFKKFANTIISTLRADIKATNDNINQVKNEIRIDKKEAKVQFEFIGRRLATMETKIDNWILAKIVHRLKSNNRMNLILMKLTVR